MVKECVEVHGQAGELVGALLLLLVLAGLSAIWPPAGVLFWIFAIVYAWLFVDWLKKRRAKAKAEADWERGAPWREQRAREEQTAAQAVAEEQQRLAKLEWQRLTASLEPGARPQAQMLIAAASFREFEHIVAGLLRDEGWTAEIAPGGPDKGVDIHIHRASAPGVGLPLEGVVQVKHWPRGVVGRPVLQALAGEASVRGLNYAVIATSGDFTQEARSFAEQSSSRGLQMVLWPQAEIEQRIDALSTAQLVAMCGPLVDGRAALEQERIRLRQVVETAPGPPLCPVHQVPMGLRFYKRYFWGCPQYPGCKQGQSAASQWRAAILAGAYPVELVGRATKADEQRVRNAMAKRSHVRPANARRRPPK